MKNQIKILLREGLLDEGKRLKVPDGVIKQIEQLFDKIENNIVHYVTSLRDYNIKNNITNSHYVIGKIEYVEAGGEYQDIENRDVMDINTNSELEFRLECSNKVRYGGYFQTNDPKKMDDNVLVLNLYNFTNTPENMIENYWKQSREELFDVMVHEMGHAMDPKLNQHYTPAYQKGYNSDSSKQSKEEFHKNYLSNDVEVVAQTTDFLNRIIRSVKIILDNNPNNPKAKEFVKENLHALLAAFADGDWSKIQNPKFIAFSRGSLSNDFIDSIGGVASKIESFFLGKSNITTGLTQLLYTDLNMGKWNDFWRNWGWVLAYKHYNPKAWRAFLSKLYHTVQEGLEMVKENDKKK